MAVGNFYGVIPYEGRYDAMYPSQFYFNKNTNSIQYGYSILLAPGEFRDAKWMQTAGGNKILALARNNDSLLFFKQTK